jgi:hypothetical protein
VLWVELRTIAAISVTAAIVLGAAEAALGPGSQAAAASTLRRQQALSPQCTLPAHLTADQIVVPIVVDFGGADARVLVTCVVTRPGDSGAQVLASQATLLRYPTPRYDESGSGLLCAIDGYPKNGCGKQSGRHYAYWSYWHGGKRWQYASDGPAEWTVSRGDVEGWRFEPYGSATPADPPPRSPSSAAELEMPVGARRATPTTAKGPSPTSASSSSSPSIGHAAGPLHQSGVGAGSGTRLVLFIVGVALIVLIGTAAFLRSRRTRVRAT